MRFLITILILFSLTAHATTYYVSNAGSNAANGTSTGTSWQTISKINGFTFSANDSILFNRGDTWNEQLIVPRTYLYFGAYGTGNKPIITGFQTQTGFTNVGNVWTATATNAVNTLNCVLLNGSFAIKARTPNSGYSTFSSYAGDSILNTSETGTPSRVGKQIVVRTATWIIDVTVVATQSTGQLKVSPKLTTTPNLLGNGYFLQDDSSFVDAVNEFAFDSTTKKLNVYSTSSPTVYVSTIDTLVKANHKRNITFENIAFTGANNLLIQVDTAATIKNCLLQYTTDAIQGDGNKDVVIDQDSIMDCWNNAVTYDWINGGTNLTLTNNYIKRIGIAAGMGKSGNGTYTGFLGFPSNSLIEYNRFDSVGYNAVHFAASGTSVKHNYITNFGFTKVDAGGIYTFTGTSGNIIRGNIIGNGLGNTAGISGNNIANGIYLDDNSTGQIVDSNTVFNCKWASCFVHADPTSNHTITNNLFEDSVDRPFYTQSSYTMSIRKNIFYSRNASNDAFYVDNTNSVTVDSNYYLRPSSASSLVRWGSTLYNYNGFTDAHAKTMPANWNTSYTSGTLLINPTKADVTTALDITKTYTDVYGNLYTNSITVHPYKSVLLFVSSTDILPRFYLNTIR